MTVTKADRLSADLLIVAVPGIPMRSMNHAIVSAAFAKHREDAERPLLDRIEKLEADNARLREALGNYADQLCELGRYDECCGRLTDLECFGCKARQALGEK